jgi:hypothetical protein
VFIDGKYVGPAANFKIARTYELSLGEHEVRVAEPRYEEILRKGRITAGKKTVLKESNRCPQRNRLSVSCEWAYTGCTRPVRSLQQECQR